MSSTSNTSETNTIYQLIVQHYSVYRLFKCLLSLSLVLHIRFDMFHGLREECKKKKKSIC